MILPPCLAFTISRAAAWEKKKVPLRLISSVRSHSSSVVSRALEMGYMPALLTRMSRLPKACTVASATFAASARLRVSARMASALPPFSLIICATLPAASRSISAIITAAPASARRVTMALPMPMPPPVTMAPFPLKSKSCAMVFLATFDTTSLSVLLSVGIY